VAGCIGEASVTAFGSPNFTKGEARSDGGMNRWSVSNVSPDFPSDIFMIGGAMAFLRRAIGAGKQ
jgi:hypothetical protein